MLQIIHVTPACVLVLNRNRQNNKGVQLFGPPAAHLHPSEAAVSWDWLLPQPRWRASNQLITCSFLTAASAQSEVMSNPCPACKHPQLHQRAEGHYKIGQLYVQHRLPTLTQLIWGEKRLKSRWFTKYNAHYLLLTTFFISMTPNIIIINDTSCVFVLANPAQVDSVKW